MRKETLFFKYPVFISTDSLLNSLQSDTSDIDHQAEDILKDLRKLNRKRKDRRLKDLKDIHQQEIEVNATSDPFNMEELINRQKMEIKTLENELELDLLQAETKIEQSAMDQKIERFILYF